MMRTVRPGILLLCSLLLLGCAALGQRSDPEQLVRERAKQVMEALIAADGEALAKLAHPSKGVRFSPSAFARTDSEGDLVFRPVQLQELASDQTVYHWGTQDGNGSPLAGTITNYLKGFSPDYLTAAQVGYNQIVKQGNTRINIHEAYPEALFVEFHLPGAGAQADFTWSSVRLLFEPWKGTWYLVGVMNDRWTI